MTTPAKVQETLNHLFRNNYRALAAARIDFTEHQATAREVAARHIAPVITELNADNGNEFDPLYLAYLIEYAYTYTEP